LQGLRFPASKAAREREQNARERARRNEERGDREMARLHDHAAELHADGASDAETLNELDRQIERDQLHDDLGSGLPFELPFRVRRDAVAVQSGEVRVAARGEVSTSTSQTELSCIRPETFPRAPARPG
jgi:hypothetical protein